MKVARRLVMALGLVVVAAIWVFAVGPALAASDSTFVADPFEDTAAWSAHPAEGVTLALASDAGEQDRALRMDVRFTRDTGYAVARRAVSLDLPADYVFRFRLRGDIPTNALEFKLVDSTGNNVWWHVRRDLEFPRSWKTISIRKRQIRFAWGPAGGGELRHVAFIEIAVTAGEGGAGSVWLDELRLEPLAADSTLPPVRARASSSARSAGAAGAVDGDVHTAWRSAPRDTLPWLLLDLGRPREFGGLDLRWAPGQHPADYAVAFSLDGAAWTVADSVRGSDGGRDPLYLPESEARFVRLQALKPPPGRWVELYEAAVRPLEWSATPEAFFTDLAREAPRGSFPRPYVGEQCAWAVVGTDGASDEALLSEDGMLETGKRSFSIEPFLRVDGRTITWADVRSSQSLLAGFMPMPRVQWDHPDVQLQIACKAYDRTDPKVWVVYDVSNPGTEPRHVTLYLAIRPFQVNPPWQNIGFAGGTARIHRIERDGPLVRVNGDRGIILDAPVSAFGALPRDDGGLVDRLRSGLMPVGPGAEDRPGFACGVLAFELDLPPGESKKVSLLVPLHPLPRYFDPGPLPHEHAARMMLFDPGLGSWDGPGLDRVSLMHGDRLGAPVVSRGSAREVLETLYAQLGWILVNRDGAAIQPGSRNYDRSWIRDGALTSSALLRMEMFPYVRDFIEWFARFQYPNGKIPCCASERGPDPVTENDSHGQFIWLVAEYYRYSGDRDLVERMWPHVAAAVAHMDSLRGERRTDEWRAPDKRKFFGLLLPSISHEGYPNPMHSYWDDFFAYRGYADAAYLAQVLGRRDDRARYARSRDTFASDLGASIAAAMKEKGIDYIPGCAELGDFDATSTTVALTPTDAADLLPNAAIRATFERYWKFFTDRRDGKLQWDGFTPYETRTIGSFVRLGWRDRANAALDFFMDYRNPPGWKQWAEVAYREKRAPKYIGDMPHTWVGSDFVRSVLDMFAYERGLDSSLVVAAGVPWRWVVDPDSVEHRGNGSNGTRWAYPLEVSGLRTTFGRLSYSLEAHGDTLTVNIRDKFRMPPGGIIVIPPAPRPFRHATVNGKRARITPEAGVVVRTLPARVVMSP